MSQALIIRHAGQLLTLRGPAEPRRGRDLQDVGLIANGSVLIRDGAIEAVVKTGLSEKELVDLIPDFSALVVRSQTKVTADVLNAGTKLRVVGRAGVGVDNVDVETATRRGVIVLNAPGGNTVSTAEHAFSLLLSAARKIPQADANVRSKKWDKKNFEGVELYNKTLGVIGMGRIGSELSRRAIAFGMRVVAYDPYLSATRARSLQVELVDELDDLLASADFISLHTPLTTETRHLLNVARLQKTKRGVRIVNCARGGLIDETALLKALQDRHVAGAALDVFETEPLPADSPLRSAPNLVLTPHLGASTAEAQESVGIEIAQSIRAALLEGTIRNAVNMPNLDAKTLAIIGPHLRFGEKLGRRRKNCVGRRRVFRRYSANCQHQQPTRGSTSPRRRARARKHGSPRNGRTNRQFARRSRREHRHNVT